MVSVFFVWVLWATVEQKGQVGVAFADVSFALGQTSLPSNAQKFFLSLLPSTQVYKEAKATLGYDYDEELRILNPAMDNKLIAILEVYDVTGKYLSDDVTLGICTQGVDNVYAYRKPFGKTEYEVSNPTFRIYRSPPIPIIHTFLEVHFVAFPLRCIRTCIFSPKPTSTPPWRYVPRRSGVSRPPSR